MLITRRIITAIVLGAALSLIPAISNALNSSEKVTASRSGAFAWPLPEPVTVERGFEPPAKPWLAGHRGVDLKAPAGTPVQAPSKGIVRFASWIVDRPVLVIDHGDLRSTLEPVRAALPVGTMVEKGQSVGEITSDSPHCSEGCLHWGVKRGKEYLNPLSLLAPAPKAILVD